MIVGRFYSWMNVVSSFIAIMILLPIPFRLFGSSWVSFCVTRFTSDQTVTLPKRLLQDLAAASAAGKLGTLPL